MNIAKKIIIVALLATFAGCTTTPARHAVSIKGPTYNIGSITYIPLSSVVGTYGLGYKWDSIAKKLTLHRGQTRVMLAIGSDVAIVDGTAESLNAPVKMCRSTIVIPKDFSETTLAKLFLKKIPVIRVKPKKALPSSGDYIIATIVIDPGHGGKDPGAIGRYGIREKDITLDISRRLKRHLEGACIDATLTRSDNRFISLWRRADIANKKEADFFISIHANAAHSRSAKGFEVYYLSEAVDDNARAIAAAENASLKYEDSSFGNKKPSTSLEATIWDITHHENRVESIELAKYITQTAHKALGTRDRGVKAARFYVLKGAEMPSVLIEVGFISNSQEAQKLKSAAYREKVAKAIASGIIKYKEEYEATEGFTR